MSGQKLWQRGALLEGNIELITNTRMLVNLKVWESTATGTFFCRPVLFSEYLHLFSTKYSAETDTEEKQYMKSNRKE